MRHDPQPRARVPIGLVAAAVIVACLVVGALIFIFWHEWVAFAAAYPLAADLLRFILFAAPVSLGVGYGAAGLMGVHNRWSSRPAAYADKEIALTRAKVQIAPLAQTFTYHTEATTPAQFESATQIVVVKPLSEWLDWVDAQPHTLLAGRTKAGKTHTATALLARRLRAGETVYIIDPHSSAWLGLPTLGSVGMLPTGKPDTAALNAALLAVASEYVSRMRSRDEHKQATGDELPHTHFGRLTVLIDEANYIADVLPTFWREFIKALASGGRKVGIAIVCLAQSPLVEDIGISGSMRANFARLALDDQTVKQLIGTDEKDGERKKALHAALVGRELPAASTIDAQVWLLDRRGLEAGSAPANAHALVWPGASVVPEPPAPLAKTEPLTPPGTGSGTTQDDVLADTVALEPLIHRMRAQQFSRNQMAAAIGGNRQKTLALIKQVLGDAS
jgi:hypothetical protein